jgi:hypothetical protein
MPDRQLDPLGGFLSFAFVSVQTRVDPGPQAIVRRLKLASDNSKGNGQPEIWQEGHQQHLRRLPVPAVFNLPNLSAIPSPRM